MVRRSLVILVIFLVGCKNSEPGGSTERTTPSTAKTESSGSYTTTQATPKTIEIKRTGQAIIEKGIFDGDCVYGLDRSSSDHAPVVFGSRATWNITFPVSHFKRPGGHYNHTFRVNNGGALVDELGNLVLPELSEAKTEAAYNKNYSLRLGRLAEKIKELFAKHQLIEMPIQEIPFYNLKDENDALFIDYFRAQLAPNLKLLRPQKPKTGKKTATPDVALVVLANSPNPRVAKTVDGDLRFQSYCSDALKDCIVSAHMPFSNDDDALRAHCEQIEKFVSDLYQQGFDKVDIAGDLNTSADEIKRVCTSWKINPPTITTTANGRSSCAGGNSGNLVAQTIDLLLEFVK
ncbi:MAG TPA: hypothetical protein VEL47_02355 [Myxococcota bacterium]|nr:hypothetical protein [Myxococcota bacterium]